MTRSPGRTESWSSFLIAANIGSLRNAGSRKRSPNTTIERCCGGGGGGAGGGSCARAVAGPGGDVAGARAVLEAKIKAIRERNGEAYLSYYLHSPALVRGGAEGFDTGFDSFAKGAGAQWPDLIEANDIHLTPLQPGIVYGTYRYRVRFGSDEHVGISERLFVSRPDGWKIVVTGAIDA